MTCFQDNNSTHSLTTLEVSTMRQNVNDYLVMLTGPAAAIFLCSLVYFPSKPPLPPSKSSTHQRLDFLAGPQMFSIFGLF